MQPPESQTELGANVFAFFVTKKNGHQGNLDDRFAFLGTEDFQVTFSG